MTRWEKILGVINDPSYNKDMVNTLKHAIFYDISTDLVRDICLGDMIEVLSQEYVAPLELTEYEIGTLMYMGTDGTITRQDDGSLIATNLDGTIHPIKDCSLFPYLTSDMGAYSVEELIKDKKFKEVKADCIIEKRSYEFDENNYVGKRTLTREENGVAKKKVFNILSSFARDKTKY